MDSILKKIPECQHCWEHKQQQQKNCFKQRLVFMSKFHNNKIFNENDKRFASITYPK